MILDSSALVSILFKEAGHEALMDKAQVSALVLVGAPIALETAIVVSRRLGHDMRPLLASLLYELNAEMVEFNQQHYEAAVTAYLRFGKGRHRAALNFGDCMSYALAKVSGLPLLYAGADFSYTDIESA